MQGGGRLKGRPCRSFSDGGWVGGPSATCKPLRQHSCTRQLPTCTRPSWSSIMKSCAQLTVAARTSSCGGGSGGGGREGVKAPAEEAGKGGSTRGVQARAGLSCLQPWPQPCPPCLLRRVPRHPPARAQPPPAHAPTPHTIPRARQHRRTTHRRRWRPHHHRAAHRGRQHRGTDAELAQLVLVQLAQQVGPVAHGDASVRRQAHRLQPLLHERPHFGHQLGRHPRRRAALPQLHVRDLLPAVVQAGKQVSARGVRARKRGQQPGPRPPPRQRRRARRPVTRVGIRNAPRAAIRSARVRMGAAGRGHLLGW